MEYQETDEERIEENIPPDFEGKEE